MPRRLTDNMLSVLERLYRSPTTEGHVHMSTATALAKHGLVTIAKAQKTWGGNFPHDKVHLSDKGRMFCKRRFGG